MRNRMKEAMLAAISLGRCRMPGPKHRKHYDYEQRRRAKERAEIERIEAARRADGYYERVNN